MIDFTGQAVIVTGAGRGLGRLYALNLAKRGAAVVVNDLGSTMRGEGVDSTVADSVVDEITAAGGRAVASYDSVDTPGGWCRDCRGRGECVRPSRRVVSNAGIFGSVAFEDLSHDDWTNAACAPRRRFPPVPTRLPGDEGRRRRTVRVHLVLGGCFRPADGGPLRGGQGRSHRVDQCDCDRRRGVRYPRQLRSADRLFHGW